MPFTAEELSDIVVAADSAGYSWFEYGEIPDTFGVVGIVRHYEDEDENPVDLRYTLADVAKGVRLEAKRQGMTMRDLFEGHDAGIADSIMQYALLGDIIYG
jgi:hypothetical protein